MDRVASLSQAAVSNPNDAGVWLELGNALLELGAVAPAEHVVARARACEPASAQHWSSLGTLLLRLGDRSSALEALRAATVLDSEDGEAAALFARTAIEDGAAEEAEDMLRRATCLGEQPVRSYLLALAKEAQGQPPAALDHALQAIRRAETPAFEHVELAARLAHALGRHDIEERLLLFIRQIDPRHVEHIAQLSRCFERRGRNDLALQELERLGRSEGLSGTDRERIGERYLELGESGRALDQLKAAVAAAPTSASARVLLARAYKTRGQLEESIGSYLAALEVEPERAGVLASLGAVLLEAEKFAEATPVLVKAVSETPEDPGLRAQLTQALLMSGGAETKQDREGSLSGDLSVFHIEELLEFLGIQRSTGKLHLTSKGRSGVVQIVQGKLTEAWYPGRASLAALLVSRRLLTPQQERALPSELRGNDARTARLLLEAKLVPSAQLESVMQARIEDGVKLMLDWADGRARFEPESDHDAVAFGFEHQRILMSVLTQLDEERK